jgi:hypothetical protein
VTKLKDRLENSTFSTQLVLISVSYFVILSLVDRP